MASKTPETRKLIRMKRNAGKWRRGTKMRISDQQITKDGLKPDDYDVLDDPSSSSKTNDKKPA